MSSVVNSKMTANGREQEQEIMSILLGSSLFGEMSGAEREKLMSYLVTSYFQPRAGDHCRAHLKTV
jgi:hypothetical protein